MTIWELIALAKSGGGGHIDASLFKFKGSVLTTDDLPDTAENGDVYHVDADGGEYVWVEDYWESLGATIDLSAYRTAAEQDVIDKAQDDEVNDLKIALRRKQDILRIDTAPTADSVNPVSSGGVKAALDELKQQIPSYADGDEVSY